MLTSRMVESEEALAIGLVNQRVADDQLLAAAAEIAASIAALPPLSVRMNKASLNLDGDMAAQFQRENMALALLKQTADAKEAAAAFREKRAPVFTGR